MVTLQVLQIQSLILSSAFIAAFALLGACIGDQTMQFLILRIGEKEPSIFLGMVRRPDQKQVPLFQISPDDGIKMSKWIREHPPVPSACHACGSTAFSFWPTFRTHPWWKLILASFGIGLIPARRCKKCGAMFVKVKKKDDNWTWYPLPLQRN